MGFKLFAIHMPVFNNVGSLDKYNLTLTLEDDNMHETKLSNPAQNGLIHGIKYYKIYNFEFQL